MEVRLVYDDALISKRLREVVAEVVGFGSSVADGWDRLCAYSCKIDRFIDLFVDFAYEASELDQVSSTRILRLNSIGTNIISPLTR